MKKMAEELLIYILTNQTREISGL